MAYVPPTAGDYKASVRAVATSNINLAAPGAGFDGVSLAAGNRVLLTAQSTASQNGIWIWNSSGTAMTRAQDADSGTSELTSGAQVTVEEGAAEKSSVWTLQTANPIVVGTTALTWVRTGGTDIVRLTGTQTITGTKTFNGSTTHKYLRRLPNSYSGDQTINQGYFNVYTGTGGHTFMLPSGLGQHNWILNRGTGELTISTGGGGVTLNGGTSLTLQPGWGMVIDGLSGSDMVATYLPPTDILGANFRGEYSGAATYAAGDIVEYDGKLWEYAEGGAGGAPSEGVIPSSWYIVYNRPPRVLIGGGPFVMVDGSEEVGDLYFTNDDGDVHLHGPWDGDEYLGPLHLTPEEIYVGPTEPDPGIYKLWIDTSTDAEDQVVVQNAGNIGDVYFYPHSGDLPNDLVACEGQQITEAEWPELYADLVARGNPHGTSGGNPLAPNYMGKVLVGQDVSQSEFDTIGETGGAKSVTLTSAQSGQKAVTSTSESVDHTHSGTTGTISANHNHYQTHTTSASGGNQLVGTSASGSGSVQSNQLTGVENQNHVHGFTTAGRSAAHTHNIAASDAVSGHTNLQPYAVGRWVMRARNVFTSLATHNLATESFVETRVDPTLAVWRTVFESGGRQGAGAGANTYTLGADDGGGNLTGTGTDTARTFYLDPTDYDIDGYDTEFRIVGSVANNNADSGAQFYIALRRITGVGGAVGVISYSTAADSFVVVCNPGAASIDNDVSAAGTLATSGNYIFVYTTDAALAANSWVRIEAQLQVRWTPT